MNSKPMFLITEALLNYDSTNKAQKWAVLQLNGFLHKTLSDRQALDRFKKHLEMVAQKAHERFPRCKKIIVTCRYDVDGSNNYDISMFCDTKDCLFVAGFSVSPILDEWEGGKL